MLILPVAADQARIGWPEQRDIGFVECGGQMAEPGIDRDYAFGAGQYFSHLLQAKFR